MNIRRRVWTNNNLDDLIQFRNFSHAISTYWFEGKPFTSETLSCPLPSGEVAVASILSASKEGMTLEVGAPAFSTIPEELAEWVGGEVVRPPDVKVGVSFNDWL